MPIFTITFEKLAKDGKHDYSPLTKELALQKCFPLQSCAWLGSFNNDATQLHNHFQKLLAKDDRLLVVEMPNHFCYSNAPAGANKWLIANPPAGGLANAKVPMAEHEALKVPAKGKGKSKAKAGA